MTMVHRTYNWMQFLDNYRTPCSEPHESCRPPRDFLVHCQKILDCISCVHLRFGFVVDGILTAFYSVAYCIGIERQQYRNKNRVLNRHKAFISFSKIFLLRVFMFQMFASILFLPS